MPISANLFLSDMISKKRSISEKFVGNKHARKYNAKELINVYKKSGIDGVELLIPAKVTSNELTKAKKILKDCNMPVFSIHQPLKVFRKTTLVEIEKLFKIANGFFANVVVLHLNLIGKQIFDFDFFTTLHELEKKYNVTVGFENSQKHLILLFKKYAWKSSEFVSVLANTGFHITLDTTHLAQAGDDIIDFFLKNKDNIVNIHISDYKKHRFSSTLAPRKHTHLPLGKGELPIDDFLNILKQQKYDKLITLEINSNIDDICASAKKIKLALSSFPQNKRNSII